MKHPRAALVAALAIPALSLAMAGCEVSVGDETTTSTIDNADLEQSLAERLSKDAGVDPTNVTVSCPDGQEAKQGARFRCTLTAPNGRKYTVDVTQTDGSGGYEARIPEDQ